MGTIADKLNYLNNTKAQIKNEINKIGGNITNETTFRNYVTSLNSIYSKLPKVEGEGSNLTLENCEDATLLLTPEGNASQETTGGKNLLNTLNINGTFSNVQVTTNPDKSITLNGTCTSNYAINIITNWSLSLENGKTYILSGCPDLGGKDTLSLELYSNSPSNQYITDIGSGKSFTLTTDRTYRCYIAIRSGKTYDNVTLYPMVEEGSIATEYEPYTGGQPSPNPDYPQPIKVVTGEQNVEISGKNLYTNENATYSSTYITPIDKNGFQIVGGNAWSRLITKRITVKKNTDYVFKLSYSIGKPYIRVNNTEGKAIVERYMVDYPNGITFNSGDNDFNNILIYPTGNSSSYNGIEINLKNIQIEEGSQATEYEPYYTPQTYPLSLGNIELARINDYKDFIFKNELGSPYYNADLDLNEWYLHKEINKVVLDGSESGWQWKPNDGAYSDRMSSYGRSINYSPAYCNYFINSQNTTWVDKHFGFNSTGSTIWFKDSDLFIDLETFKAWLQTNNAIVYYVLATPRNTKITDTTLVSQLENINNNARSYKDTTYIFCSSESEDNETIQASVTALKDISTLFEQVNNAIIEIGGGE